MKWKNKYLLTLVKKSKTFSPRGNPDVLFFERSEVKKKSILPVNT